MTQFNQELIAKARKGEIAILNDGSVEELKIVLTAVWPKDGTTKHINSCSHKYFVNHDLVSDHWFGVISPEVPAHSVKDFFMTETKDLSDVPVMQVQQSRTYRVTRQQMKEIWEASKQFVTDEHIVGLTKNLFGTFSDAEELTQTQVKHIVAAFPTQQIPDLLKSIFPEYFFIPEGEPVLCRREVGLNWFARVSDGKGGVYFECNLEDGLLSEKYHYIIPFTKNPPK